jgi:predicted SAM-dependent methyltransferase
MSGMSGGRKVLILNVGCGGREGDKRVNFGDVRIDVIPFSNVTHRVDAHKLPQSWTGKFSLIVCETALEHFISPYTALGEMSRVLQPGGEIQIIVPNVHYWRRIYRSFNPRYTVLQNPVNPPDHKQAWDLIEIRNLAFQFNLYVVKHEFLDWLPEKKHPPRIPFGSFLVKLLPKFMQKTEVRFTLRERTQ